jgi:hypothetical protein
VLIRVPMVGRFLVPVGGPVLVEREPGAADSDLRCFLDEPVAAAAALLRGDLVLHAATVAIGGRAVVLCGPSAVGKSALAAALAQRGHAVLADGVTAVAPGLVVAPLAPEPVLWPDTVDELGLGEQAGRPVRPALSKRAYRIGPEAPAVPLAAVVYLHARVTARAPAVEPVTGAEVLTALLAARWHAPLVAALGCEAAQFQIAALAATGAAHLRLVRPRTGTPSTELADLVEAAAG